MGKKKSIKGVGGNERSEKVNLVFVVEISYNFD